MRRTKKKSVAKQTKRKYKVTAAGVLRFFDTLLATDSYQDWLKVLEDPEKYERSIDGIFINGDDISPDTSRGHVAIPKRKSH